MTRCTATNRIITLGVGAMRNVLAMGAVTYTQAQHQADTPMTPENVLEIVDTNGNGQSTCAEAWAAGHPLPMTSDRPA